jgi:hypothetical protein
MNYLVLSYCPNVAAFQHTLAYFAQQDIEGISNRIHVNPETRNYIFDMFKAVVYSEDGAKSVGILEVFPQYYEGVTDENGSIIKPDLFTVINSGGEVLQDLASCTKYLTPTQVNDVYSYLDGEGIAKIREVVPEFKTIQDENGEDVIVEQSYKFAGLA